MWFFWLGCQHVEVVNGTPPSEEGTVPSEYVTPEEGNSEDVASEWELEAISGSLSQMFEVIRTRHASPILDAYAMVMSQADAYCPQAYTLNGNSFWYGACTSTAGMTYDGYLFYNTYSEYDFFGDGGVWDVEVLSGSTQMLDAENSVIHWGGTSYLAQGVSMDGYPVFFSSITGSFMDDGASPLWLQEGRSDTVMMYGAALSTSNIPANAFMISGSMEWDATGAVTAVEFGELVAYSKWIGYPCEEEPLGALAVRDAQGRWLDVAFDVSDAWVLTGECDGCGLATYNGEPVGEVCIDTEPLLDWEGTPWLD